MAGWGRRLSGIAAAGLVVQLSACTVTEAGSAVGASPVPVATTSAPSAATTTTTHIAGYEPPSQCLLTVVDVSDVLDGEWKFDDSLGDGACFFFNDRGLAVVVAPVGYAPDELASALAGARVAACDTDPVEVPGTDGGFVCVRHAGDSDYIEGRLIAADHLWLFQILGFEPGSDYPVEIDALVALLGSVPR